MDKQSSSDDRNPSDAKLLWINSLLFLSGLVLILSGTFILISPAWLSNTVIGLGVGLLGTAVAGTLTAWIIAPHSTEALQKAISKAIGAPAIVLPKRSLLSETYLKMMKEATEIEIVGLTLKAFFVSCSAQDIAEHIRQGKHFKILLLFPDAYVTQIRQREEKATDLVADIEASIRVIEGIFKNWQCRRRGWHGSFEVRFYDTLPYLAYFRADEQFIIGFYYHHIVGHHSECILVRQKAILEQDIATNLEKHFGALWQDNGGNTLCRIDKRQGFFRPDVRSNAMLLKGELK